MADTKTNTPPAWAVEVAIDIVNAGWCRGFLLSQKEEVVDGLAHTIAETSPISSTTIPDHYTPIIEKARQHMRHDDCMSRLVPSDVRVLVSAVDLLTANQAEASARARNAAGRKK